MRTSSFEMRLKGSAVASKQNGSRWQIDMGYTKTRIFLLEALTKWKTPKRQRCGGKHQRKLHEQQVWKQIFGLKVPEIVKCFIWKAGNDILPTRKNCFKREIIDSPLCPICEREVEKAGWPFSMAHQLTMLQAESNSAAQEVKLG